MIDAITRIDRMQSIQGWRSAGRVPVCRTPACRTPAWLVPVWLVPLCLVLVIFPEAARAQTDDDVRSLAAGYSLPVLDLANQTHRQVVVDQEPGQYLGHPTTVLLEDGQTLLCVYPKGHGKGAIVLKRSIDGGKTWSPRLPVPENWATSLETPTIHRVEDAAGNKRLILFSGLYPIRMAVSNDDGETWTPLKAIGDFGGIVAMGCVQQVGPGRYLALFHDDGRFINNGKSKEADGYRFHVYQTQSDDGGLTWSPPHVIATHPTAHLCEPGIIRSPDGKQLAVLLRENSRRFNSFLITSDDNGTTWSTPQQLPAALTGDRHVAVYAPDGRLLISFRDTTRDSPTHGDWVAWVGTYADIINHKEGQYRVRLMDNHKSADCAYPGVEILPDGTIVCTTYGHWTPDESPYIVSVRLKLEELDEQFERDKKAEAKNIDQWSQFRGSGAAGVSPDPHFPSQWQESDFAWQRTLEGSGNSSPVIWGQTLFLQSADVADGTQHLECCDLGTGEIQWTKKFPGHVHATHAWGSLASATPCVDADRIYFAWGSPAQTTLCALDHQGNLLWQQELGPNVFTHGFAASPVLLHDQLLLFHSQQADELPPGAQAGQSRMLSLNPADGKIRWSTDLKTTRVCYGVPNALVLSDGTPAIVAANTGNGIFCLDARDGKMIWEQPVIRQRSVAAPVVAGDLILASSGSGGGGNELLALRWANPPATSAPAVVYRMSRNANYVPSPVVLGQQLFVPGDKGFLSCLNLSDGEILNQIRIGGRFNISSSPVIAGQKLFLISDDGLVKVFSADEQLRELGEYHLHETTRATPAIGNGYLVFRTDTKIYALKSLR